MPEISNFLWTKSGQKVGRCPEKVGIFLQDFAKILDISEKMPILDEKRPKNAHFRAQKPTFLPKTFFYFNFSLYKLLGKKNGFLSTKPCTTKSCKFYPIFWVLKGELK